jgi:hypothetical protein
MKKIHRRYSDDADRDDLRSLALCNNINGPICHEEHLTGDDKAVTCGRCKRIMYPAWKNPPTRAFSSAARRRNSRKLAKPRAPLDIFEDVGDGSAWAPLTKVSRWLKALATDNETLVQVAVEANQLASELDVVRRILDINE